jgi:hypothetical protein
VLAVLFCAAWVTAGVGEKQLLVETPVERMSSVSSTFTDGSGYDAYHHAGSPIGLLDTEDASARLALGHRLLRWADTGNPDSLGSTMSGFVVPSLRIGRPELILFGIRYTPAVVSVTRDSQTTRLPLHRFGFELAGQARSKLMRIGFSAQGYYGKAEPDSGADQRVAMGLDRAALHLGSQIHELVRLGFWGGATAQFDSLKDNDDSPPEREDRFFAGAIPTVGFLLDFGADDLPVMSNFALSFSRHHFVYVVKPSVGPINSFGGFYGTNGNRDAVVTDSLAWDWQTMGDIDLGMVVCRPALRLGYWRSGSEVYLPKGDNYPTRYEREREGYTWRFSSFTFGLGGACAVGEYGTAWVELGRASFALDMSDSLEGRMEADLTQEEAEHFESSRGLVRFGAGFAARIHALEPVSLPAWLELELRFGFVTAGEPAAHEGYRTREFEVVNHVGRASQVDRYRPYAAMLGEKRVSNVGFGLGARFLERMLGLDLHLGLLRRRVEGIVARSDKGVEFGVDMTYALRKSEG